ncbi:WD repeat-containing protein 92 [Salpingoeca rosetta]|uniref:WD repeat-containing protein 92 n=1 Tax=Salpingoeca rosetta (strain ATCC 50818 / BSB-021) TaxID=946362 RepID=F2TYU5_SALR5|nr:WD repeat-containing protein 92 [Salpingoeca rosetta]EGD78769.1 WD repeat-containing protein 92 [Salpingoeca rosetta]|eukprot:XP_004997725.1 WD repeat-containing protein 92 [Salpingoeca rosetta]
MEKPNIIEHIHHGVNYTLFDGKWVPSSARCVLLGQHARGTGALEVLHMSKGKLTSVTSVSKPSGFKCGTFGASPLEERSLATGCFDGSLFIWDLERLEVPLYHAKGHTEIVNCIDGCGGLKGSGAPEIVTGSRDGSVKVWDPRQPDEPVVDISPEEGQPKRDCWAVAFGNTAPFRTCHKRPESRGGGEESESVFDRDVFVTCGGNGSVNLWKYHYPKARQVKDEETGEMLGVAGTMRLINNSVISTQPINSFDWHTDMRGLSLTTSFDQTARVCLITNLNLV